MCNYIDMTDFYENDLDLLCGYVDGELSTVLNLINCDAKIEVFLWLGRIGTPYVACNDQTITQEKRLNILSEIDSRKVMLASKDVRFKDICENIKLYLRFDTSVYEKYTNIEYASCLELGNNSFLEAVLKQFIIAFENGYIDYKTEDSPYFSYYHMIQKAGNDFMGDISLILGYEMIEDSLYGSEKLQYFFPDNLLFLINDISLLKYETSVAKGRILICIDYLVDYQYLNIHIDSFYFGELKKVRKLLEITRQDLIMVVEGNKVIGFIVKERIHKISKGSSVLFEIDGPIEWTAFLISGDREKRYLIHNQRNKYMYEYQKIDKNDFIGLIQSALKHCDIDLIWNIVQCVINNSKHGAMIIFAENAEAEAERLQHSSFKIVPTALTPDIVKHITSIDGAILFDTQGVCYSIGVILDGIQTKECKENISNGARHNSAVRYLECNPHCVIIVISEDGDLKIFS